MAEQTESIKIDRKARLAGGTFQTTDVFGVNTYLDLQAKWSEIQGITFSYGAANRILYGTNIAEYLTIGDVIRWKQTGDGSWRYAYVISSDEFGFYVYAGDDYVVANLAITELWLGTSSSPDGFPWTFDFTATERDVNSMSSFISLQGCTFSLQGNIATVNYHCTSIHLTGTAAATYGIDLPSDLPASDKYLGSPLYVPATIGDNGALASGYILLTNNNYILLNKFSGNFTLGLSSGWLDVQFSYTVQD